VKDPDWRWHGTPGHLCVAARCCFHLHTTVGEYRVSTVGCYHPESDPFREHAPEAIGYDRLYETMVFRNGPSGEPDSWSELEAEGYNDPVEAERGHLALCRKWAEA
jgi:hypothetical protein